MISKKMSYTSVFLSLVFSLISANDISVDYECSTFKQMYRKSECCEDSKARIYINYTCPDLSPPPPPDDAFDIIRARDSLRISFPSTDMTGFATLKNSTPYGLLGDLVRIASVSIFGDYVNEKVVIVKDDNTKFLDIYNNNIDIAFSFAVETNEPRSFMDHNGLQHTADFDLDTPYMKSSPAMTIKPEFYRPCNICKDLDLRGKLLRAVFKKKSLYPSAVTFTIGITQTPASVNVAHMIIETMNTYIKEKSGMDVVVADPGLEWDAMIGPDFLLGDSSSDIVLLTESDISNYHLDYTDTHSLVYTTGTAKVPVRNTKLKNAVSKALSCLSLMDKLGVQTIANVTTPYLQTKLAGTCTKVLEVVGSGKAVKERVFSETSYTLDAFH